MENSPNDYNISFFKPTTERARFNRTLVVWLASIWFVAIFGFQIALRVLEKPTPEPAYLSFENVWTEIKSGSADHSAIRELGQSVLSVLGKVSITEEERNILAMSLSWSVFELVPDTEKETFRAKVTEFVNYRGQIETISDQEYIKRKQLIAVELVPLLKLDDLDPRTPLLPVEILVPEGNIMHTEVINLLPDIMKKYLIHNQSFLTDTKFLGFPFHYFYTAVFLLILFVGLCLIYCLRSDRRNAILGIEE